MMIFFSSMGTSRGLASIGCLAETPSRDCPRRHGSVSKESGLVILVAEEGRDQEVSRDDLAGLLSWIEIEEAAVASNLAEFRRRLQPGVALQAVVKSNAYGHGLELMARVGVRSGADSFGVHTVDEAERLASLDLGVPILILGYVGEAQAPRAVACGAEVTVYNPTTIEALSGAAVAVGRSVRCHVKVETGVNRQGIMVDDLGPFLDRISHLPGLVLAGVSTHFANIEDTTDHSYARKQLEIFREVAALVRGRAPGAVRHCACSAAVLTMPETLFDMVRVGIGVYGLWPSKETLLSILMKGKGETPLKPVMTWKARIAQIKAVPSGAYVGYGCTYRTTHPTRIAVLPIGYADGYDRRLSGIGAVLIGGRRALVLGRVCMNLMMIDVTDVEGVRLEDEVVLLGRQGSEEISAAQIASLCNTISYEIVSRINPQIPRILV
jgi:alanine racemase